MWHEPQQAFSDYQRTQFGRWPWASDAPVHDRGRPRFAKFPDGHEEFPDGPAGDGGGGGGGAEDL